MAAFKRYWAIDWSSWLIGIVVERLSADETVCFLRTKGRDLDELEAAEEAEVCDKMATLRHCRISVVVWL